MITITWFISIISVTILVIGIVATIVIRIDNIPKWRTVGKILIWIIGIIIFRIIFWWLVKYHDEYKTVPAQKATPPSQTQPTLSSRAVLVDKVIYYDYYWKLDRNQFVNGQNEVKPNERTLELVRLNDKNFDLKQSYVQCGSPQTCWFTMQKTGNGLWEGDFKQNYPEDHGRITLFEISPGIYSGKQTWEDGKTAICSIKRK